MMETTATLQLPSKLYDELQLLATEERSDPVEVIGRLVAMASRRRAWLRDLEDLREEIRRDGGLQVGTTRDKVVERLRQTRREIFEAEYAHLY
jgi:hypothetical protein